MGLSPATNDAQCHALPSRPADRARMLMPTFELIPTLEVGIMSGAEAHRSGLGTKLDLFRCCTDELCASANGPRSLAESDGRSLSRTEQAFIRLRSIISRAYLKQKSPKPQQPLVII